MKRHLTTLNMVQVAMFTAILSILSQISFELPGDVPITLQTLAVVLVGSILGPNLGALSIIIYLLLGSVGLPVFASLKSGLSVLVGPTGGYLIGFLPMVFFVGLGKNKTFIFSIFTTILGLLSCHIIGLIMYYYVTNTWLLPSVPLMLAKDFITSVLAIILGRKVSHVISY